MIPCARHDNGSRGFSVVFLQLFFLMALVWSGCATPAPIIDHKPTEFLIWPPPPQPVRITYLREIRFPEDIRRQVGWWARAKELLLGKRNIIIIRPYGLTVDANENLLIADSGAGLVHIYNLQEGSYQRIPHKKDDLILISPIDTGVDQEGRIFVSDSVAQKVYVFNPKGRLETALDDFLRPTGLAVNRTLSRVYVVDTLGHSIRVFGTRGDFLFDFGQRGGGPAEFNYPTNIALDRKGNVYVTDSMNFRIQVFDPTGRFLYDFGSAGKGPGTFSKPRGIGVDSEGHIYVADAEFDNVQIMNSLGQTLLFFGKSGLNRGEFYLPAGLEIDSRDRIFVADSFNQRIQVFQYLKEEKEFTKQETEQGPSSLLMLSREGSSAFVIEKSSRTLVHYKIEADQVRLVKRYPFETGDLDRLEAGYFFGRTTTGIDPSAEQAQVLEPLWGEESAPILLQWGDTAAGKAPISRAGGAYLVFRDSLSPISSLLHSPFIPFLVEEEIQFVSRTSLEKELRDVLTFLKEWEKSWETMDFDSFIRFYSGQFRYETMDLPAWKAHKASIFAELKESEITARPIHILHGGPTVLVTLLQNYRSEVYSDEGIKKLLIHKEGPDWKILREVWKPYE